MPIAADRRPVYLAANSRRNGIYTQIQYYYKTIESPIGKLALVACDKSLTAIRWGESGPRCIRLGDRSEDRTHPVLLETERQLNEYFDGRRKAFSLKLEFAGTEFQNKVWRALADDSLRGDADLRADREASRQCQRDARGRSCQREESDCHRRPLPSGCRCIR